MCKKTDDVHWDNFTMKQTEFFWTSWTVIAHFMLFQTFLSLDRDISAVLSWCVHILLWNYNNYCNVYCAIVCWPSHLLTHLLTECCIQQNSGTTAIGGFTSASRLPCFYITPLLLDGDGMASFFSLRQWSLLLGVFPSWPTQLNYSTQQAMWPWRQTWPKGKKRESL